MMQVSKKELGSALLILLGAAGCGNAASSPLNGPAADCSANVEVRTLGVYEKKIAKPATAEEFDPRRPFTTEKDPLSVTAANATLVTGQRQRTEDFRNDPGTARVTETFHIERFRVAVREGRIYHFESPEITPERLKHITAPFGKLCGVDASRSTIVVDLDTMRAKIHMELVYQIQADLDSVDRDFDAMAENIRRRTHGTGGSPVPLP